MTAKITIANGLKRMSVPVVLIESIRDQLEAMNTSPAHAVSWVLPRSHQTSYMIDAIDAVMSEKPKPAPKPKRRKGKL